MTYHKDDDSDEEEATIVIRPYSRETHPSTLRKAWIYFRLYNSWIVLILTPLLLSPLLFLYNDTKFERPAACAFLLAVMALFWTTETLPIAVTALLPVVLGPLLQVIKAKDVSARYMPESNMAFFGSIIVVMAFQKTNLHKRFALWILLKVGSQPRWLMAGFMVSCWALSMWTSNTMVTTLLVPICTSVVAQLRETITKLDHESADALELTPTNGNSTSPSYVVVAGAPTTRQQREDDVDVFNESAGDVNSDDITDNDINQIEKMLLLSVAYSASIGGACTLIGTGPNLVGKTVIDRSFEAHGMASPLTFLTWMLFAVPTSVIMLLCTWVWLQIYFFGASYAFGFNKKFARIYATRGEKITAVIKGFYDKLEPMRWSQYAVIVLCSIMVVLLVSRELQQYPLIGWDAIAPGYTSESTATVLLAVLLFIIPGEPPKIKDESGRLVGVPPTLLQWSYVEKNFPLGVILLIGGGIAAAECARVSLLSEVLACWLVDQVGHLEPVLVNLIVCTFVVFVTEIMSNTACITLMGPIFAIMATELNVNPLLFVFPTTVAASFAFLLPVATPPNAIIFVSGRMKIIDMVKAGMVLNILGIFVIFVATNTWGNATFGFYTLPWDSNATAATAIEPINCTHWL